MYSSPLGMPRPLHCGVCGARVRGDTCTLHGRPDNGYISLLDKYVPLVFIRRIEEKTDAKI